jgi:hypothetical protein
VKDLPLTDAKLNYIRAWQSLPEYGISLFIVKFMGHKKEELLGVAFNRLMRMDISTGDHIKTWRYNTMKVWLLMDLAVSWHFFTILWDVTSCSLVEVDLKPRRAILYLQG